MRTRMIPTQIVSTTVAIGAGSYVLYTVPANTKAILQSGITYQSPQDGVRIQVGPSGSELNITRRNIGAGSVPLVHNLNLEDNQLTLPEVAQGSIKNVVLEAGDRLVLNKVGADLGVEVTISALVIS